MSDLNMQITREFFELNLFYVLPHWRFESVGGEGDALGAALFVEQPRPAAPGELGCLLHPGDVKSIQRAVVEVRAWHADRLYASVIEANPIFSRVASQKTRTLADAVFNGAEYRIVLVVSEFSQAPTHRDKAVRALEAAGIDHVIEFPTMLADMLGLISTQDNYAPSQTLQTLRLLKRYNFIRRQQLELFFPAAPPEPPSVIRPDADSAYDLREDVEEEDA